MKRILALGLVLFASASLYAQTSPGKITDLEFIKGNWIASVNGRSIEASWLAPKENNIVGFFRMMNGGKPTIYELLVYEQTGSDFISLVKHFESGLIGQEPIDKPVRHRWIESGKGKVIFEKEGEQTRILYEKKSENEFMIAVGKPQGTSWTYTSLFEFKRAK